jgi:hypothetical protein
MSVTVMFLWWSQEIFLKQAVNNYEDFCSPHKRTKRSFLKNTEGKSNEVMFEWNLIYKREK